MRGGPDGPDRRDMRRPPPPEKAGRIRIKMGRDMEVDIKCDDDAPFRECVDAAMTIINRVAPQTQQQQRYYDYQND
jgi:hypothetical protein